jgi:hypothetical protein
MESRLLTQIIERGSDMLAEATYRQLVRERLVAGGSRSRRAHATSWQRLVGCALQEGLLEAAEARQLLRELGDGRAPFLPARPRTRGARNPVAGRRAGDPMEGPPLPRRRRGA